MTPVHTLALNEMTVFTGFVISVSFKSLLGLGIKCWQKIEIIKLIPYIMVVGICSSRILSLFPYLFTFDLILFKPRDSLEKKWIK